MNAPRLLIVLVIDEADEVTVIPPADVAADIRRYKIIAAAGGTTIEGAS